MGAKHPETNQEMITMPQGITLRMNQVSDLSPILSQIDSIFAISLIELINNFKELEGLLYYSNPYEQYCKENLSFLMKYLRQAKVSSGLDFMLENFGFDQDDLVAKTINWSMY